MGTGNGIAPGIKAVVVGNGMNITEDGIYVNGERVDGTNGDSRTWSIITIDSDYTVDPEKDEIILLNKAGLTVTWPKGISGLKKKFTVKDLNHGSQTMATSGGATIDGATSQSLTNLESLTMVLDGGKYYIV